MSRQVADVQDDRVVGIAVRLAIADEPVALVVMNHHAGRDLATCDPAVDHCSKLGGKPAVLKRVDMVTGGFDRGATLAERVIAGPFAGHKPG
ncbi:hypothetical protein AB0O34_11230 [Sphaerisporangium sp. NPDC088356]|uniref:hypothetical protein n=1 Tax=Sphaerisporangium sp. NPDC088356 TaxID=3154871 RepID=UPI00343B31BF